MMRRLLPLMKALIEVIAVFGLAALAFRIVYASPLGAWERQTLQRPFLEYLAVMAVPLIVLALARRDFAAIGFLPVAALALVLNVVNWRRWPGALLVLALEAVLLLTLAWLVRNKPTAARAAPAGVAALLLLAPGLASAQAGVGAGLSAHVSARPSGRCELREGS